MMQQNTRSSYHDSQLRHAPVFPDSIKPSVSNIDNTQVLRTIFLTNTHISLYVANSFFQRGSTQNWSSVYLDLQCKTEFAVCPWGSAASSWHELNDERITVCQHAATLQWPWVCSLKWSYLHSSDKHSFPLSHTHTHNNDYHMSYRQDVTQEWHSMHFSMFCNIIHYKNKPTAKKSAQSSNREKTFKKLCVKSIKKC